MCSLKDSIIFHALVEITVSHGAARLWQSGRVLPVEMFSLINIYK